MKKLTGVLFSRDKNLERTLIDLISRFNLIEITDVFQDIVLIIENLNLIKPDILFVDMDDQSIDMMYLMGIINKPPFIIGITSDKTQVPVLLDNGFYDFLCPANLDLDYFCKKINKVIKLIHTLHDPHLLPSVQEAPPAYNVKPGDESAREWIFVKYQKVSTRVRFDDILYINNVGNALKLFLTDGKTVFHKSTLRGFLPFLPEHKFCRINNSTIINVSKIDKYNRNNIIIHDKTFVVSRIYIDKLKKKLNLA